MANICIEHSFSVKLYWKDENKAEKRPRILSTYVAGCVRYVLKHASKRELFTEENLKLEKFLWRQRRWRWKEHLSTMILLQCDQIGRFLKVLGYCFSRESSQNVWKSIGLIWKEHERIL